MSNKIVNQGKYSAFLQKAPESGATEKDGEKAPAIQAMADFSADGEISIKGNFTPENIRFTKKSGAPYVSITWEDSYPLRSGTATIYVAKTFVDEIND